MYLVNDDTMKNANAMRDLARILEPLFLEFASTARSDESAGIDIKIPARYIARTQHVEENSIVALMYSSYCKGFIEGALYHIVATEQPERIAKAQESMKLVRYLAEFSDEQIEQLREMTYGKIDPETAQFFDKVLEIRSRKQKQE